MIQYHQVSIHELKAVQFVVSLLSIGDLVINDEGGALGGGSVALSDLADWAEFAEETKKGRWIDGV